jgi:hypothetical protein
MTWLAKVLSGNQTEPAGLLAVALPDGAGSYVLRRLAQDHVSGAGAATHSPVLFEDDATTRLGEIYRHDVAEPVADDAVWPDQANAPAAPGRFFFSATGNVFWDPGGNAGADVYALSLMVERVR